MSPNEQKIYAVIYDRIRFGRLWTSLAELADETKIKKPILNTLLYRMNKNGKIDVSRNKGIFINGIQRISDAKFD